MTLHLTVNPQFSYHEPVNPLSTRVGWCYALTHDSFPGLVKIGATRKHPLERTKELGGTALPTGFILSYYRSYPDAFAAESALHNQFAERRASDAREFFSVSVAEVVSAMDSLSTSVEYREAMGEGMAGGEFVKPVKLPDLSMAELFATFPDRGDGVLNAEEQAACRALERRMAL